MLHVSYRHDVSVVQPWYNLDTCLPIAGPTSAQGAYRGLLKVVKHRAGRITCPDYLSEALHLFGLGECLYDSAVVRYGGHRRCSSLAESPQRCDS